jgi:hypothetical protein
MSNSGDINSLWNTIKSSENMNSGLAKSIQLYVLDDSTKESSSFKKRSVRNSKRISEKQSSAKMFGNPLRNVSENLIKLYRNNSKYKSVISPVFEALGYNKKQKKFLKWPILLKDFIYNLHQEIMNDKSNRGNLTEIKEEAVEAQESSKCKTRANSKKTRSSKKQNSTSKQRHETKQMDPSDLKKEDKERQNNLSKFDIKEESERDVTITKTEKVTPTRNLHSSAFKKEEENLKMEESKSQADDIDIKVEKTPQTFNVDMGWDEDLEESQNSESVTVRTILSPNNADKNLVTGEKDYKPQRKIDLQNENWNGTSCQRTHDQTNKAQEETSGRNLHLSTIRKDYGSLKRNLFDEFKNISNNEDNMKKETVEEILGTPSKSQWNKNTPVKEIKHSLLDWMSPPPKEGPKFENPLLNSITPTPVKGNCEFDQKPLATPYSVFKDQFSKNSMPHFMPFNAAVKENQFRQFNESIDSQMIYEELCGKKRAKVLYPQVLPSLAANDISLIHSAVFSPSKIRYGSYCSSQSDYETPHMYEGCNEQKPNIHYTPHHAKEQKSEEYKYEEEPEEEQDDETENNPGIRTARSERGLKRLSVKVRDLVFRLKETSYKDVANRLIDELVSDSEYDEYGARLDKKASNDRKTKEEKNVRRRVYDALNVLIASGVLKKNENKNVMYEERPESRMKGLKLVIKRSLKNKKRHLIKLIHNKRKEISVKKKEYKESESKLRAIEALLYRNKLKEERETRAFPLVSHEISEKIHEDKPLCNSTSKIVMNEIVEKIPFPMLVVGTENIEENKIKIWMSTMKDALILSFKEPFSVMGDMDVLLRLGFGK